MVLQGHGEHLGMPIRWRLQWAANGAFEEVLHSQHLTSRWGCPGVAADGLLAGSWEVDHAGLARPLELDDHEVLFQAVPQHTTV